MNATTEKQLTPEQIAAKKRKEYQAKGRIFSLSKIVNHSHQQIEEDQAIEGEKSDKNKRMRQSYFHTCYRLLYLYYKGLETGHTAEGWLETSTALIKKQTMGEARTVQRHLKLLMGTDLFEEPFILERKEGGKFKHYNYQLRINPKFILQFEAELEAKAEQKAKATGIKPKPSDTLRDFMHEITNNPNPTEFERILMQNLKRSASEFIEPPPN